MMRLASTFLAARSLRICYGRAVTLSCALLLTIPAGAVAQVPLQLLDRVDEPGARVQNGPPLPAGSEMVILEYPARRAHTLANAGTPRKELGRLVLEKLRSRGGFRQIGNEGRTASTFPTTAQSGNVLYVLARTPADSLFESYVNTGDGFRPGFDEVESGRMTMGPVPAQPARRYRAVFRVYREETDTAGPRVRASRSNEPGADTSTATGSRSTQPEAAGAEADSVGAASSGQSASGGGRGAGLWSMLLVALAGGLVGGGVTWYLLSERARRAEKERNELRRRVRKEKEDEFRAATGSSPGATAESGRPPDSNRAEEIEQLRQENEDLRSRNETLERQIHKIKEHIQKLRNEKNET